MPEKKKKNVFAKFTCDKCQKVNYYVHKSKKDTTEGIKLSLKKFCNWCRSHTLHKEKKK
jgi:large subunit ribosomal protein L33